ncbi:hypothetical protein B0H12DRAFT_1098279 [Mycena haematopus]|nr:hypothetical protein B0H12DRAFT_1122208 [Mycena haematopus]KAJ7267027.1 hypothetical protein B0H12DRAFT_1099244 [Mycena haematopus]KAJ7267672.1 hypothetical protein B0H12DRAFT_1098279 [Mycena haematopus]
MLLSWTSEKTMKLTHPALNISMDTDLHCGGTSTVFPILKGLPGFSGEVCIDTKWHSWGPAQPLHTRIPNNTPWDICALNVDSLGS